MLARRERPRYERDRRVSWSLPAAPPGDTLLPGHYARKAFQVSGPELAGEAPGVWHLG